jgi:hypothetical protein
MSEFRLETCSTPFRAGRSDSLGRGGALLNTDGRCIIPVTFSWVIPLFRKQHSKIGRAQGLELGRLFASGARGQVAATVNPRWRRKCTN